MGFCKAKILDMSRIISRTRMEQTKKWIRFMRLSDICLKEETLNMSMIMRLSRFWSKLSSVIVILRILSKWKKKSSIFIMPGWTNALEGKKSYRNTTWSTSKKYSREKSKCTLMTMKLIDLSNHLWSILIRKSMIYYWS